MNVRYPFFRKSRPKTGKGRTDGRQRLGLGALLLILLLAVHPAAAKDYRVEDIPLVHLQDRTRYVSNPDQILSETTVRTLDRQLQQLEQQTGIQVLVVAVTGIEGGDCFDFAYRLGEQNGVGQKGRDNGLIVLLSTDERCIQFATGYGLEGILPDAICKRIQGRYMLPYFKDNRWDEGMQAGMKAVHGYLDGSMENLGQPDDKGDESLWTFLLPILLFVGAGGGLAFYMAWRNSRCPYCQQHQLQRVSSHVISRRQGIKTEEVTYLCRHCGHTLVRREQSQDENYRGPRGGSGPIFMGGGGFGGGGGGFSGGSYGGGSFGGGGAGSKF